METNQLILILGVLGLTTWAGIGLLRPFATAFAQRLKRRDIPAADDGAVTELREELAAVQERLDFVERALAAHRSAAAPALPSLAAQPLPPRVPTPA